MKKPCSPVEKSLSYKTVLDRSQSLSTASSARWTESMQTSWDVSFPHTGKGFISPFQPVFWMYSQTITKTNSTNAPKNPLILCSEVKFTTFFCWILAFWGVLHSKTLPNVTYCKAFMSQWSMDETSSARFIIQYILHHSRGFQLLEEMNNRWILYLGFPTRIKSSKICLSDKTSTIRFAYKV